MRSVTSHHSQDQSESEAGGGKKLLLAIAVRGAWYCGRYHLPYCSYTKRATTSTKYCTVSYIILLYHHGGAVVKYLQPISTVRKIEFLSYYSQ